MTDAMHRGGPDDNGHIVNTEQGYALGHRRLSIIDISPTGHQPMIDVSNSLEIVFNGEIYNYKELKDELISLGHNFVSESDTEVILKGYQEWRVEVLNRLRGMFAFVLIDKKASTLFAARDHAGIKPLYIGKKNGNTYFSSEVRGLKALNKWEENNDWQIWFLTFGFLPEPITTLNNVSPLPKGHYLLLDLTTKKEVVKQYYSYTYNSVSENYSTAVAKTRQLVEDSVKRHLVSDVPVGVFLSGGIDSSILTLIAQKQSYTQLETISIFFDDEKYSEKEYQDLIAQKTGVKHHSTKITKQDFIDSWDDIFESLDQPTIDAINSYFICKFAKQKGFKVVLSGLGADEIFGGYPSIKRSLQIKKFARLATLKKIIPESLINNYPAKKVEFLTAKITTSEYLLYRGLFTPKDVAEILNISPKQVLSVLSTYVYADKILNLNPQNRATYFETTVYMQNQLLKDSDTQSMWHSLELRVPFLDRDLMDYVNNLSTKTKFSQLHTKPKSLLVDAFIDELPAAIWQRPKMGFTFPFEKWFKEMSGKITHSDTNETNFKKFTQGRISVSRYWATLLVKKSLTHITETKRGADTKILFTYLTTFKEVGGIQKVNKVILKCVENISNLFAWGIYDTNTDKKYFSPKNFVGFKGNRLLFVTNLITTCFNWNTIIVGHINIAFPIRIAKYFNSKLNIVLIAHGIEVWDKQHGNKKWLLENSNKIIAVSNFTKQELVKVNGINEAKIQVLPNCLDPYFEEDLKKNSTQKPSHFFKKYSVDTDCKIILTVSRIRSTEKYKGYDKVLEALAKIKKLNTCNFKYLLCGGYDAIEYERVSKIITDLNLNNDVIITGFIPDDELIDHYKFADVFVMPSQKEGFGIVFIEAAACGTNVIAGNSDGSAEALQYGKFGELVNPNSIEDINDALLKFLSYENKKNTILAEQVKEFYSYEKYKTALNQILFG